MKSLLIFASAIVLTLASCESNTPAKETIRATDSTSADTIVTLPVAFDSLAVEPVK